MKNTTRLKLGIVFNFNPTWMGGVIYIINIIKTLDFLDDIDKPEIFLFYRSDLTGYLNEIKYPYLNLVEWTFPSIVQGYLKSWFLRRNVFVEKLINKYSLDAIYPVKDLPVKSKANTKIVAWYADLQHKYYPDFFSRMTILGRNIRLHFMLRNTNDLVVSSKAVMDDFTRFFKLRKGLNLHIFHFVSINDGLQNVEIEDLRIRYNLPERYFLVSNQFHKHKNHKVLLLALAKLKDKGIKKHLTITGKFPGAANSPYLAELHRIIEDNNLHDQISLLGVIPRCDQLQIMRHSQAVLQPSLFEGWSTVIEDAMSLQVPVVASNLPVNIEQLGNHGVYFDPHNPEELASILVNYPARNLQDNFYEDYPKHIKESAKILIRLFQ